MSSTPKISSFSIIIVFLCIALAGVTLVPLLPVKLLPSRTLPRLNIQFSMPGNSARVVELTATSKLEAMLSRIKGIKSISSNSGNGWGNITLELDKHTSVDAARFEASTIVRQTWPQLPDETSYPNLTMSRPDEKAGRPFMSYTLNAATTPFLIQRYAEENIKTRLSQIPGISRIEVSGATPMEWRLAYDNQQLIKLGVTVDKIQQAIQQYYKKEFLGTGNLDISSGGNEWIRLALIPKTTENVFDPSLITVVGAAGKLIRLDQLLTVLRTEERPRSYFRINGLNSIYLSIRAEETANQLELSDLIRKELNQLKPLLPAGYELHPSYDATEFIKDELDKIYIRTGLTILILLVFVWLITFSSRHLLLIILSLSANLSISVIFYYLLGLEMQLYSLAGITISLSLVIDNTIVMTDHILHHRNRKAFLSLLAATSTTIGALIIIFFLDEKIRLNLQDFAAVVIINLAVSLFISLFLVPALIEKLGLQKQEKRKNNILARTARTLKKRIRPKRITVYFDRYYKAQINFFNRFRISACLLLVLLFGIPIFLIPDKMEGEGEKVELYNKIFGSKIYKEDIKPIADKALGGSLRLFIEKVYAGSYFSDNGEVELQITATLPSGSTLDQMNNLMQRMETYLSEFKEIKQFQTNIYSAQQARLSVTFTRESENSGFPYTLKSEVISKALQLGGGSWGVYGLQDQGFGNDVRENAGSSRINLYGYNYDDLYAEAEKLKATLLTYRRIKEVLINSEYSWWKDDYKEFYFGLNKGNMAKENISPTQLFHSLRPIFGKDVNIATIIVNNEQEKLKLSSKQSSEYDIWNMLYQPQEAYKTPYKLATLASVNKGQTPQKVVKKNQQYVLCIQYEYVGSHKQGSRIQEKVLKEFNASLPMGYKAESDYHRWSWGKKDSKQYLLLLLIIVIIFFTTSILFNSLKQPLAVIFVIPISYIGVFLTFFWFKLNFDQGGFASFVLLCGITVNSSIYILNEYNQIREKKPLIAPIRAYLKAWNAKIIPIFLTVISTILGFVPFMLGENKEAFWFPLAAGTIGGLIMSVIGIFFYLPIFTIGRKGKK